MYENGKPFFKIWNIVILRERVSSDFDTCMRVFMKFVKDCSKHSKRKTDSNSIANNIWFVAEEFVLVMYRLIRFVELSIKSCENLLYYACKKGVPVMRCVRNSGFSLRELDLVIVVVEEFLDLMSNHQEERNLENNYCT